MPQTDSRYEVSRNQDLFSSHEGGPIIWDLKGDSLKRQQANLMGMEKRRHLAIKRSTRLAPKLVEHVRHAGELN